MDSDILTQEKLTKHLSYNCETGLFSRLRKENVFATDIGVPFAGTINNTGYYRCSVLGKVYLMHRLAWLYVYGYFPKSGIDHINMDRTDNRICNLRIADKSQNAQNQKIRKNNKSGTKGVHLHKGKWVASIQSNGKRVYLGAFKSKPEAEVARNSAELVLHPYRTLL